MTSPACASSGPQEQDGRGPWWDTTILTAPAAIWLLRWPARIRNAWSASSGSADACAYERRNLHDPNLEMIAPSVVQVACRVRSGIELQFVGQPCPLSPFWRALAGILTIQLKLPAVSLVPHPIGLEGQIKSNRESNYVDYIHSEEGGILKGLLSLRSEHPK